MISFNDYINTNVEDSYIVYDYYLNFLTEFSSKNFPFDEQLKVKGAGGKFLNAIESTTYVDRNKKEDYLKLLDSFLEELRKYRRYSSTSVLKRISFNNSSKLLINLQEAFENIYSKTLELINEATNKTLFYDSLDINDFYKPDNSNKPKIRELINEAIDIIRDDESLNEKSKNIIIDYLSKALSELERERVNWTRFLGRIKETVIVLGALGSFAGGVTPLFTAKDKLEQSTEIIQKTSLNFNFNVINQTFNVQNIQQISSINNILELPQREEIHDAEVLKSDE